MDALPWADIDTTLTHDAFALVDVDELLGLDGPAHIIDPDLYKLILIRVWHHWWVGIGFGHAPYGSVSLRCCHPLRGISCSHRILVIEKSHTLCFISVLRGGLILSFSALSDACLHGICYVFF